MKLKIGLIGCGNLVNAIFKGFIENNQKHQFEFYCYTPSKTRAKKLAEEITGKFCEELSDLQNLDVYLFGFKPQNYSEVLEGLKNLIPEGASVWSLLAGISSEKIRTDFPQNSVIRIMPNTASKTQKGISLYHTKSSEEAFPEKVLNAFKEIFASISSLYELPSDDKIDQVTGVSASGPALLFELGIHLAKKLESFGLEKQQTQEIVRDLFVGTGSLLTENINAEELRDQVTSKKGVTYEALGVFRKAELDSIVSDAIDAAYKRSVELRG